MSEIWLYAIGSVILVSFASLVGIFTLSLKDSILGKMLLYMVSFSAGAMMGGAFLHLLPESVGEAGGFGAEISLYVLMGIVSFFFIEKFIHWRHCHIPTSDRHPHPFAYMNLFGDGVHNFIDGLIIGASYIVSIPLGIATTLAVLFHEIPQEIGDFGVLLHGGFSKNRALFMNFLTALTAVAGAAAALVASIYMEGLTLFLVPFAAGNFLYIATSDLIPELKKECGMKKSAGQLIFILLGIGVMYWILLVNG
jgi:zinc and cadmium transporter